MIVLLNGTTVETIEALRLLRAFHKIKDPAKRRAIIDLEKAPLHLVK